jgi:hypothetical protein
VLLSISVEMVALLPALVIHPSPAPLISMIALDGLRAGARQDLDRGLLLGSEGH